MPTLHGSMSLGEHWAGKRCYEVSHEGMRITRWGRFHVFLDKGVNSLPCPCSPVLCTFMLPSLELSSSFSELSAFLAFIITRGEDEVYLGESCYIIYITLCIPSQSFPTQIISDLKKISTAKTVEIDSNPLRKGANSTLINRTQCCIYSRYYSIKIGTNIRNKAGTFPLDQREQQKCSIIMQFCS